MANNNYVEVSGESERVDIFRNILSRSLKLTIQTGAKSRFETHPVKMAGDSLVIKGEGIKDFAKVVVSFILDGQPYFYKSSIRKLDGLEGMIETNCRLFVLHRRANFRVSFGPEDTPASFESSNVTMTVINLSLGGMKLEADESMDFAKVGEEIEGILSFGQTRDDNVLVIVRFRKKEGSGVLLGVEFDRISASMRSKINQFLLNACRYDFYSTT